MAPVELHSATLPRRTRAAAVFAETGCTGARGATASFSQAPLGRASLDPPDVVRAAFSDVHLSGAGVAGARLEGRTQLAPTARVRMWPRRSIAEPSLMGTQLPPSRPWVSAPTRSGPVPPRSQRAEPNAPGVMSRDRHSLSELGLPVGESVAVVTPVPVDRGGLVGARGCRGMLRCVRGSWPPAVGQTGLRRRPWRTVLRSRLGRRWRRALWPSQRPNGVCWGHCCVGRRQLRGSAVEPFRPYVMPGRLRRSLMRHSPALRSASPGLRGFVLVAQVRARRELLRRVHRERGEPKGAQRLGVSRRACGG